MGQKSFIIDLIEDLDRGVPENGDLSGISFLSPDDKKICSLNEQEKATFLILWSRKDKFNNGHCGEGRGIMDNFLAEERDNFWFCLIRNKTITDFPVKIVRDEENNLFVVLCNGKNKTSDSSYHLLERFHSFQTI
jgi:hypothetical protein